MLVFARDVASANATADVLRGLGPPVLLFHREVPQVRLVERHSPNNHTQHGRGSRSGMVGFEARARTPCS